MNTDDLVLTEDSNSPVTEDIKLQLLVRLEKLLQHDWQDTDSIAFQRNFRDCKDLYDRLDQ